MTRTMNTSTSVGYLPPFKLNHRVKRSRILAIHKRVLRMETIRVLRVEVLCITSEALQVDMLKYQLQKLECAKAAYLRLPLVACGKI